MLLKILFPILLFPETTLLKLSLCIFGSLCSPDPVCNYLIENSASSIFRKSLLRNLLMLQIWAPGINSHPLVMISTFNYLYMTFFQCSLKGLFKTTWVCKVWFSKTVWFQHLQKWSHASGIITKSALNIFISFFLVQVTFLRSKISLALDHFRLFAWNGTLLLKMK